MTIRKMTPDELQASLRERLDKHSVYVPFCGCRIWTGALNEHGYGMVGEGGRAGRTVRAHRAAWELERGKIPDNGTYHGTVIRHKCNTPACINVDHMELGTQHQNIHDAMHCGRVRHGSGHHAAKLSVSDIERILSMRGQKSQSALAAEYGVNPSVISRIYSGGAWRRAAAGDIS